MTLVEVYAPGRVNLIGDHTDYNGGLALPMAIDLGTTVYGERRGDAVVLRSPLEDEPARVGLDVSDPAAVRPPWARYVAGVVAEFRPPTGFDGHVATTLPVGGGLSSSAALVVGVALALGADEPDPASLARRCQAAEQRSGIPCGVLDQMAVTAGVEGHALLLDCETLAYEAVPVPGDIDVIVLDSGEQRRLTSSAYAERRAQCERAAAVIGPLRSASLAALDQLDDDLLRRRARHVITENQRVRDFADALRRADYRGAGELLTDSHHSLRDDFEVSTAGLDHLVRALEDTPGVYGARLTGAGFGGCVVAISEPRAVSWTAPVRAAGGARVVSGH